MDLTDRRPIVRLALFAVALVTAGAVGAAAGAVVPEQRTAPGAPHGGPAPSTTVALHAGAHP